jgi:hypothetical protein
MRFGMIFARATLGATTLKKDFHHIDSIYQKMSLLVASDHIFLSLDIYLLYSVINHRAKPEVSSVGPF